MKTLKKTFSSLFGQFRWVSPPWFNYFHQKARTKPMQFWGMAGFFILFLAALGYGYHWYKNQPKPQLIEATIIAPKITPLADELIPDNLTIDFGKGLGENFVSQSVAPLNWVNKEINKGIQLKPAMPGKWLWSGDNRLVFTPAQDWPAGQTYSIHFEKDLFRTKTAMASYDYSFSTAAFKAKIAEFKFYQDPVNSKIRQAIATIEFNFPVDKASLEDNTSLMLQALQKNKTEKFKFKFDFDKHQRRAYLHSEVISLSELSRFLLLTIDQDVKSGAAKLKSPLSAKLLIPNKSEYLKISKASAEIIRNTQDRPEQILTIESSLGLTESQINKSVHAYLLPQNYPATAREAEKINYKWTNPGEVSANILALAKPLAMQALPSEQNYSTLHSYKFNAKTPQYIYLKIDKGMRGFGDFVLSNDYRTIIKVPEYPKEISFLHKGALIALSSEKKLSVLVRGLPAVKFSIARVLPENVNQLVTQTQGDFNNPFFINQSFNQQNISEIFSEIQQFNATDLNQQQYRALDFSKYLSASTNSAGPHGLFLLKATGWDLDKNEATNVSASRLILITDLGLVVKDNSDGSHDVFVQSITTGTAVANATLSVLGKNGLPILTKTTDLQGRANFPTLKDYNEDKEPTAYLAGLGSDLSFIPFNKPDRQLNYSRFEVGGLYSSNQELNSLSAYLFSDRGIYRPGDAVHIGMIVKQAYAKSQPAGLPLEVRVTDPRGATIKSEQFILNESGLLDLDFKTALSSPTGVYYINLFIVKDAHPENLLGSTTIRVAEFQPDRMRISSAFSQTIKQGWLSPKDLKAKVELWNLYGAPAASRKIAAKILLAPKAVQFTEYPDYVFVDPMQDPKKPAKVFTDSLPDGKTDDKGQVAFNLNLDRFNIATYQLTFFAEGFEAEGGRSVSTQSSALISPLPYFIGYKADRNLSYIKQNSQHLVNFIAINQKLKQLAVDALKIQLVSLHPVSTLVKKADGTYQYQSIIQSTIIDSKPFAINEKGNAYQLATDKIGDFALTILDKDNTELSQLKFSVVGASQQPMSKNAELSVKLNKAEYKAGEDIELQITAPYTGAGLITIERDKVYATQWFKTDTSSSVQKIHIPEDFQGNGYVNVSFVRDWESAEIFISPLSYSIVPFKVNHDNQTVHIKLNSPKIALPGETLKINYKTDKPGKIIVFAVDEGILQVANYKTPDPLAFFFQKHALEVLTQQTVDLILPKFIQARELSAVGGDGSEELLANHLNPFKRKTDLPVVYWSGIVDSDSTPRELSYQIPTYFNGSLRVMAVAVAADALGSVEKKTEVRGHFIINPNTPTFVAPGDEFEITASIANNVNDSGDKTAVTVQLTASPGLEIIGNANEQLEINEGQEKIARFKLRATSVLGSASLSLTASSGSKSSKMDATLSVRPATPFSTSLISGVSKSAQKQLALIRLLYPEYRKVEASMSSSPLILVAGLKRYLDGFPYGCTEQLTSEAFPLLAMAGQSWFAKDSSVIQSKIDTTIQMLSQRQRSNGSFSYWPGLTDHSSNSFASIYAMQFLTEARQQNYAVPADLFSTGLSYLRDLAAQTPSSKEQARIQAYAIYVLTANEIVTTNYLTNLQLYLDQDKSQKWQEELTGAYIAATYQLLQNSAEANHLISKYKSQLKLEDESDFYNSKVADAQYLYLVARHFPNYLDKVAGKLILSLVNSINSEELNTLISGYSSLALSAYAKTNQILSNPGFSITQIFSNNIEQSTILAGDYLNLDLDENTVKIIFKNPNKQRFFYQLTEAGFDKKLATKPVNNGLEIYREYRDKSGTVLTNTSLGSEIEVHIQVRSLDKNDLSNIAIVDLLPGGFEVVRDSINTENIDYADTREDRVVFFTGVNSNSKEIVYRIKATNAGRFTLPPIQAESMYNPSIYASGEKSEFTINPYN